MSYVYSKKTNPVLKSDKKALLLEPCGCHTDMYVSKSVFILLNFHSLSFIYLFLSGKLH